MKDKVSIIKKELRQKADPKKAKILLRFFKTGKGEYGEGDRFLGVVVPEQRRIARKYLDNELRSRIWLREKRLLNSLLASPWHEERLTALLILVELYKRGDEKFKKQIFNFYLKNIKYVNNWDLVDLSAPNIVGDYLFNLFNKKEAHKFLLKLAKSKNLWTRRVAVLATFAFIKQEEFEQVLELAEFLLIKQKDRHDLMHKALGWMLREVGKKDEKVLVNFLNKFGPQLPRTTLRYAIERFTEAKRSNYLKTKNIN